MDYARALVDHPKWRWEPGMVTTHHVDDYSSKLVGSPGVVDFNGCPEGRQRHGKAWWVTPDINHPATKGWLLHMLREATGDAQATTGKSAYFDTWTAFYGAGETRADAYKATEGEALAAALLAVWGQAA